MDLETLTTDALSRKLQDAISEATRTRNLAETASVRLAQLENELRLRIMRFPDWADFAFHVGTTIYWVEADDEAAVLKSRRIATCLNEDPR